MVLGAPHYSGRVFHANTEQKA